MDIRTLKKIMSVLIKALNDLKIDLIDYQRKEIVVIYPSIYDYILVCEYMLDYDISTRFRNIPKRLRMREEKRTIRDWIKKDEAISIYVTADFTYLLYLVIKLIEKVIDHPGNIDLFNSNYITRYIINMRDIVRTIYSIS